jgi:hypothetical protein
MDSLSSSLILLVVALVLLWLAVTDRLSRVLDAVDVLRGNATVSTTATTGAASGVVAATDGKNLVALSLPSLPALGRSPQVSL